MVASDDLLAAVDEPSASRHAMRRSDVSPPPARAPCRVDRL